mmetsp:Transcript_41411/g.119200  ORF Transcript_41411/g.119200 Transcript_41411/m.119200 type:complete len:297 (-) Transcript_41411:3-893(-)
MSIGRSVAAMAASPKVESTAEYGALSATGDRCGYWAETCAWDFVIPKKAEEPLQHAKCCVVGLLVVSTLRGCAIKVYSTPAGLHWTAHMLSTVADAIGIFGSSPVFANAGLKVCVQNRFLGSLMTLLLTAVLCDLGAAFIFVSTASPSMWVLMRPMATEEGAPSAVAFIGVWECILVASNLCQAALCVSVWRFYRALREAGVYPPDATQARVAQEVSPFELVCEAEDVALLSDHCSACGGSAAVDYYDSLPYAVAPGDVPGLAGINRRESLRAGQRRQFCDDDIEDEMTTGECWAL